MTGAEEAAKTTPTLQRFLSDVLVPKGVRRDSWCFRHTLYLGEIVNAMVALGNGLNDSTIQTVTAGQAK